MQTCGNLEKINDPEESHIPESSEMSLQCDNESINFPGDLLGTICLRITTSFYIITRDLALFST